MIPDGPDAEVINLGAARAVEDVTPHEQEIHRQVVAENSRMIGQLRLLGKEPTTAQHLLVAVETLLDVLFADKPDALQQFHYAVDVSLNARLQMMLKEAGG